jgi:hypothetical protein
MSMIWRDPRKELPTDGSTVAVMFQHWKQHNPKSCEVMFGVVRCYNNGDCLVETDDFTGKGNWYVELYGGNKSCDTAIAWMPANEFVLPEWVPHDEWWERDK